MYSHSSVGKKFKMGLHWAKSQGMDSPVFLLEGLGENLFPYVFQLLETALIPHSSAHGSFLHLQSQQDGTGFLPGCQLSASDSFLISPSLTLTLTLLPPSSTFKDLCDYIDCTRLFG